MPVADRFNLHYHVRHINWDALPALHDFAGYLAQDFEALRKAAQT